MILSAGLDGIKQQVKLRPMLGDTAAESVTEPMPTNLQASLDALKRDDFLISLLGTELSTAYIAVRESEAKLNCDKSLEEEVTNALIKA